MKQNITRRRMLKQSIGGSLGATFAPGLLTSIVSAKPAENSARRILHIAISTPDQDALH
jgi:hypothetical protein